MAAAACGSESPEAAADCSDWDRRYEADETIAVAVVVVERLPERVAAGASVAAECTLPEPSVVGVGGIYARCRPGKCRDQQRSASPNRTLFPSVMAAPAAGYGSGDGGIAVAACWVVLYVTTMTSYWKRLASRSKRWWMIMTVALSCSRDRSMNGPSCCWRSSAKEHFRYCCDAAGKFPSAGDGTGGVGRAW